MTFTIRLHQAERLAVAQCAREYDTENDNIVSLLVDVCQSLDESGAVRFIAGGFGTDSWPVDVRTDLAVVLEQLPMAIRALLRGESATVDFFEQGIERLVTISIRGEEADLRCQGRGAWKPSEPRELADVADVLHMLEQLLNDFVAMVEQRCPDLRKHVWFEQWLRVASPTDGAKPQVH